MTRFPLVLVCLGGVAAAQPVTHPDGDPCRVTVVLAPDEVRTEIEAWVRAEPRCARELEVRVVPTEDGGLYLQARDRAGRVRERVVPDAQSAAVLVVSWMADDSTASPALATPDRAEVLQPPSVQLSDDEHGLVRASATEAPATHRWLTLGALASEHGGFRGQLDLFGGPRWSLGIAGGWRHDRGPMEGTGQARVVLGTERSFSGGRFAVRAQIGLGFDTATRHEEPEFVARVGDGDRMDDHDGGVRPTAEAGLFAKYRLGNRWGLFGGPLIEANDEHPTISVFFGVQRGL